MYICMYELHLGRQRCPYLRGVLNSEVFTYTVVLPLPNSCTLKQLRSHDMFIIIFSPYEMQEWPSTTLAIP